MKRFGSKRVPGCRCADSFTCGECLADAASGLPQGGPPLPRKNVHWGDVRPSQSVELRRGAYVVDGEAVAYWHGAEATEAQRYLDRLAERP